MLSQEGLDRQTFIGGSDARIIMGGDEAALVRLWQEKRGEVEPVDLSGELIVQLGLAKLGENMNLRRFERFELKGPGLLSAYVHTAGGKKGSFIELSCPTDAAATGCVSWRASGRCPRGAR